MPVLNTVGVASQFNKTVSTAALSLIDLGFSPAQVNAASRAFVSVETNSIRYAYDGTAPTAANGHLVAAGGSFTIVGNGSLQNLKVIRASVDAVIQVTLEN